MRRRILDIFNTVTAENKRPIGFSIGVVLIEDLFINTHRLIKFVITTEVVSSVVHVCTLIIIEFRQRLLCAAVFTSRHTFVIINFKCATAHFTFEN